MGVAIFRPSIDLEGKISVSVRVDKRILSALNAPGAFIGNIKNHENVGRSTQEIVTLWNAAHPDDLIVLEPEPEPQP